MRRHVMWAVCDVSAVQPHLYFGLFGWGHAGYNDGLLLFIVRYYLLFVGPCTFLCILVVKYFTLYYQRPRRAMFLIGV